MAELNIRRTVTIPKYFGKEDILAIIDVGGQVLNKDRIYQKFFEYGLPGVKEEIIKELKIRGGDEETFKILLNMAKKKFKNK